MAGDPANHRDQVQCERKLIGGETIDWGGIDYCIRRSRASLPPPPSVGNAFVDRAGIDLQPLRPSRGKPRWRKFADDASQAHLERDE